MADSPVKGNPGEGEHAGGDGHVCDEVAQLAVASPEHPIATTQMRGI